MEQKKRGFQPGHKHGVVFTPERQPSKRGRKPALYKQLLKNTAKHVEFELSKEDYYKVIRFLMERTPGELREIVKDERTPIWICNIVSAIFADIKHGRTITFNAVFDRLFGKPTQTIVGELNGQINHNVDIDLSVLSTEELIVLNNMYEKITIKTK